MADMVFLQGTYGSRVIFAGCPVCGRISRQTLTDSFDGSDAAVLSAAQKCPVCGTAFERCSNEEMPDWIGRFISYTEEPEGYNASARRSYLGAHPETAAPAPETPLDRKAALWKGKLLDLSMRNRMLNYRDTRRSTLRITEPGFSELFKRLALDDAALTFRRPVDKDTDLRTFAILSLLETLDCPIPVHIGDIGTEGTILERQNTLKNLRSKAKLAQEEQGTNILYLSFGFLEWREKNTASAPWHKAPLLLMPVSLELPSLNAPYRLRRHDDEVEVNPTLQYFLHEQFGADLPPFELKDASSAEQYLTSLEELADSHGWKVSREISLGLLSFLKISMYHDLESNRVLMEQNPVIRALAGETDALPAVPAGYDSFDFDATSPADWYQVVGADSSQQEAILLSKLGISFVMQGPPGTGKSQTITNIIAEAIADGKKVLFVSEKAAALQVVLKRLSEAHLDDFCLALHSHKANKKEILESIGANLKLRHTRVRDGVMEDLAELFHDREQLNAYASELHEEIAPLNESLYSAFGKLSALDSVTDIFFVMDDPLAVSEKQLAAMIYALNSYARSISQMSQGIQNSPWHGTTASSAGQTFQREFLSRTAGLDEDLTALADVLSDCAEFLPVSGSTMREAVRVRALLDSVLQLPELPAEWLDERGRRIRLDTARLMQKETEKYRRSFPGITALCRESIFALDHDRLTAELQKSILRLSRLSPGPDPDQVLRSAGDLTDFLVGLREKLIALRDKCAAAAAVLHLPAPGTLREMETFAIVCDILRDTENIPRSLFDPVTQAQADQKIRQSELHTGPAVHLRAKLSKKWYPGVFELDAEQLYRRFKEQYVGFLHVIMGSYRADMRTIRELSRSGGALIEDDDALAMLETLRELQTHERWIAENAPALRQFSGSDDPRFKWIDLKVFLRVIRMIGSFFQGRPVPASVVDAVCGGVQPSFTSDDVSAVTALMVSPMRETDSVSRLLADLEEDITAARSLAALREEILPHLYDPEALTCRLMQDLRTAKTARRAAEASADRLAVLFGSRFAGADTDWDSIVSDLEKAELSDRAQIPAALQNHMADPAVRQKLTELCTALTARISAVSPKLHWFIGQFTPDALPEDLTALAERYARCAGGFTELDRWLDHLDAKAACDRLGLSDFTDQVESGAVGDAGMITDTFKKAFYRQWCEAAARSKPSVRAFRRRIQDERIERFTELDDRQLTIAQARIREKLISSFPDESRLLTAGEELRLLKRELGKKRRIMPLRKLFAAIPNLLTTLKPCLMMSPLSVAHFLDAKSYSFDMVIFDEASQIFPQDAVGAIFRGKQVIIAGDSKQLPPTNFFAAGLGNDDFDDEDYEETAGESILEEASAILPSRTLLWHYRSRHEHLIAFSNQEIYGGDLITFPSSRSAEPDTGVEFCYVEDGIYENGRSCNIPEALRCVQLVKEHLENHPDRSLGIIAFSEKQQQAISQQIQRFREQNPQYEAFFTEGRDDEFFVKNLENVQGDERDTIIFSICYARTAEQKRTGRPMSMRFGPLGHVGGERRLNVAITRAKQNIKLVSSILPSDIDLSKTDAEGIRMLRSYIEFARNGDVSLRRSSDAPADDGFAAVVAGFLESHGYKVRRQLGCSGYKLDIAVEHPDAPDRFIAAVECDGPVYVSARTARDRDHLRRSVLRSMGWNVYQVWSAEWLNNPAIEGEKLLAYLREVLENTVIEKPAPVSPAELPMEEVPVQTDRPSSDFPVYVEADWAHAPDASVEGRLLHIISIEQPVHTEVLYGRMVTALDRKMVSPVVRRAVDTALARLSDTGKIRSAREFWTLPGFNDVRVRVPAPGAQPRQIAHIPTEEIALAILSAAENSFGLTEKELMDETACILGYTRSGPRIAEALRAVLDSLLSEGRLQSADGKIQTCMTR